MGLRLLPSFQEARSKSVEFLDCEKCMKRSDRVTRQHMRCGLEPALEGERLPNGALITAKGTLVQAWKGAEECAGSVMRMPEVVEMLHAYPHWEKGTLPDLLDGERPTSAALVGLAALQEGLNAHQADKFKALEAERAAKGQR